MGIRLTQKSHTVRVLNDLVRVRKQEVLFLIETVSVSRKAEELRIKLGFANVFSVDRVGRSGGIVVFWNQKAECSVTGYSQNHMILCLGRIMLILGV